MRFKQEKGKVIARRPLGVGLTIIIHEKTPVKFIQQLITFASECDEK